jgi:protein-S-isoprenylcysteine O-methyltransferase Ste14
MAWLAFTLYTVGLGVVFGLRTWLYYRATGDTGHRHAVPDGAREWLAHGLLVLGVLVGLVAPLLAAVGVIAPVAALDVPVVAVTGLVVAVAGFAGVLGAQSAMGRSWRVGVDPQERTELVTGGIFGVVRNPVFSAMIVAGAGLTAMTPTWAQLLALAMLVAGIQLQVRAVEEPYLATAHGTAYSAYAGRVGRFAPGVGRLRTCPE